MRWRWHMQQVGDELGERHKAGAATFRWSAQLRWIVRADGRVAGGPARGKLIVMRASSSLRWMDRHKRRTRRVSLDAAARRRAPMRRVRNWKRIWESTARNANVCEAECRWIDAQAQVWKMSGPARFK